MPRSAQTRSASSSTRSAASGRFAVPNFKDSLVFDGVNDIGSSNAVLTMNSRTKLTICSRIQMLSAAGDKVIFEYSENHNNHTAFLVASRSIGDGSLDFTMHNDTFASTYAGCRTPPLTVGTWYSIVWTWDGTLATNEATVFINGVETNVARQLNGNVVLGMEDAIINFGARATVIAPGNFRMKDWTAFSGKVFTQAEINDYSFRNKLPTPGAGESRVAQYLFNEGTGTTVAETGNSALNLTLTGSPAWATNVPTIGRTAIS